MAGQRLLTAQELEAWLKIDVKTIYSGKCFGRVRMGLEETFLVSEVFSIVVVDTCQTPNLASQE